MLPVLDALVNDVEVPLSLVGEITESDVVFMHKGDPVEGLTGWNDFA